MGLNVDWTALGFGVHLVCYSRFHIWKFLLLYEGLILDYVRTATHIYTFPDCDHGCAGSVSKYGCIGTVWCAAPKPANELPPEVCCNLHCFHVVLNHKGCAGTGGGR
jgi:hypothetical protein